jgi:hypothetical protein
MKKSFARLFICAVAFSPIFASASVTCNLPKNQWGPGTKAITLSDSASMKLEFDDAKENIQLQPVRCASQEGSGVRAYCGVVQSSNQIEKITIDGAGNAHLFSYVGTNLVFQMPCSGTYMPNNGFGQTHL